MPRLRHALLPLLTLLTACGGPTPQAAMSAASALAAQSHAGAVKPADIALGIYYAFDDYVDEATQENDVKWLQGELVRSLTAAGPKVYLSADLQKAPDFRAKLFPGQAWGQGFEHLGELASNDASGLRDFLHWLEADSHGQTRLTIDTHGGASQGLLWDYDGDPTRKDYHHMTLQNVAKAIAKGHTGPRLASVNFDACMMASIEVGEALKGVAQSFTGCEDIGMSYSIPYSRLIQDVQAGQCADGEAYDRTLTSEIVQHGTHGLAGTRTWSAVRLDAGFDALVKGVDRLSLSLAADMQREPAAVRGAIADTQPFYWMQKELLTYGDFNQRDLVDFSQALTTRCQDAHVRADAAAIPALVKATMVAFEKDPSESMANGLAIFLPPYADGRLAAYRTTTFGRHTHWADFLAKLGAKPGGS